MSCRLILSVSVAKPVVNWQEVLALLIDRYNARVAEQMPAVTQLDICGARVAFVTGIPKSGTAAELVDGCHAVVTVGDAANWGKALAEGDRISWLQLKTGLVEKLYDQADGDYPSQPTGRSSRNPKLVHITEAVLASIIANGIFEIVKNLMEYATN